MDELIREYVEYISRLNEVKRPNKPKFDISAYTESEYISAINELMLDFDLVDDFERTIEFLKGED